MNDVSFQFIIQKYNNIFLYIIISYLLKMRFEQSNPNEHLDKKSTIDKKRMIRKNKLNPCSINSQYEEIRHVDTSKLTRQQKARIQKIKNRQAAQKSRDIHREYVTNLQKQVCQLRDFKDSMNSRRFCMRCKKQLQNQIDSNESQHQEQSKTKSQRNMISSAQNYQHFQEIEPQSNAFCNSMNYFQQQQESFIRLDSNNHSSYMSTIFFVAMIVVGVLIYGNYVQRENSNVSRALMEIPQLPQIPQIKEQVKGEIAIKQQQKQKNNVNQTALAAIDPPINSGLVKFNDQNCLQSLMNKTNTVAQDKKSLRSYNDKPLITETSIQNQQGILLCTVRLPKNADNKLSNIRSSLIKLYLLGSQIKQMITASNLMIPVKNTNIQINGLYKISAEIRDVDLVSDHNCLL